VVQDRVGALKQDNLFAGRKLQLIILFAAPEAVSLNQKERQVKMKCIVADVFLLTMPLDSGISEASSGHT
jgi:hypothetical protein